jgi:methanogenic corrinoid protein MtbC1
MKSPTLPTDGLYPMRVVSRLTGLSPDVIRVWQRRYGAVTPARTDGNARRFTAADVRRLALLGELVGQGHAIMDLATLDEAALTALQSGPGVPSSAAEAGDRDGPEQRLIEAYLAAITRFDAATAADHLALATSLMRPRELVLGVVLPLLREVGARWHAGKLGVAEEHLVTAHVRGVLDALLRRAAFDRGAERVLVTTPEGHLHEFGALVGAMLAAARGYDVLYLGPSTPERELARAAVESGATLVLQSVVLTPPAADLPGLAERLRELAGHVETWIGLPRDHALAEHLTGVRLLHRFEDLDAALLARRG